MLPVLDMSHYASMGPTPHTLVHIIALLAAHPGLQVTSIRRSVRYNQQVGGARNSWHLKGRASDFVGPEALLRAAARTAAAQRVSTTCTGPEEVLLEKMGQRGQHLHVAW